MLWDYINILFLRVSSANFSILSLRDSCPKQLVLQSSPNDDILIPSFFLLQGGAVQDLLLRKQISSRLSLITMDLPTAPAKNLANS